MAGRRLCLSVIASGWQAWRLSVRAFDVTDIHNTFFALYIPVSFRPRMTSFEFPTLLLETMLQRKKKNELRTSNADDSSDCFINKTRLEA